jgi:predicted nucleotidyltransferase component of viral defense system
VLRTSNLPVLLDMPSPHLRAYPPETVIAEKLHAMVVLGRANSRMKDYYDVWMLTSTFDLDPERMRQAIAATFARRSTVIPTQVPDGLSDAFAGDPGSSGSGTHLLRDLTGSVPQLDRVVADLRDRLMSVLAQR